MCSRITYRGTGTTLITGRTLDWMLPSQANLWVLPAGLHRHGAAKTNSFEWTAQHGSVVASMYDGATVDGINDAGLAASVLYLSSTIYPARDETRPGLAVGAWAQWVLDSFATTADAVAALREDPFQLVSPALPGGFAPTVHLTVVDATGDNAIVEFIDGAMRIHHGYDYRVTTNEPHFEEQLALTTYWNEIGGQAMLPGTERASDRFVRASYYLSLVEPTDDTITAVATMFSLIRNVSVPWGATLSGLPNIAPTLWRVVADHGTRTYYFESTRSPNVFWVDLASVDLSVGAPVLKLVAEDGPIRAGEVSAEFEPAEPFAFLPEV